MAETATAQIDRPNVSEVPQDSKYLVHLSATRRYEGRELASHIIERRTRPTEQHYRSASAARSTAGASQPEVTNFPSYGAPLLRNRHERRRYNALRNFLPDRMTVMNKWQGQILSVEAASFRARLYDLARPDIVEIAEFSLTEVPPADKDSVRVGAIFYWYILLNQKVSAPTSLLWFRRGAKVSPEVYEANMARLGKMWDSFGWTQDEPRPASGT